jgi:glucosamine--fructose-6-phosphate aminotransferase (isomerizing)
MCGIFGFIGKREALPFIVEGLKRLEYRGYDSAGIATLCGGKIFLQKCVGKISCLEESLHKKPVKGKIAIGHTRWATHGRPSDENSHPHSDCTGKIVVVHNGIIENYLSLRRILSEEGHKFSSATDTEVIAHLIEKFINEGNSFEIAVRKTLKQLEGSFALAILCEGKDKIIAARRGSPLILGVAENEMFVSSDIPALLKYTSKIMYLNDNEMAILTANLVKVTNFEGLEIEKEIRFASWDPESAEKEGYAHFMLKEIHEQPRAIRNTIKDHVNLDSSEIKFSELTLSEKEIKDIKRVVFTACGTSWHAGLIGEYLIEQFAQMPAEVEYAAEFRYRHPIIDENTLVVAITQSGETADTLGAVWEAKAQNAKVISICNVVDSSIARESHGVIYTHAGPEIGVASTKAFTTQLAIIYLFAVYMGKIKRKLSDSQVKKMIADLMEIPQKLENLLSYEKEVEKLADRFHKSSNALFLGRGKGFPIALEGALKLKEISYIHAEGYPAAEMKHGPIALIDKNMPVVVLALAGRRYDKILGNIEEVKARGGIVIAIATEGDETIKERSDETILIPATTEALSPILAIVPLQIFAYYIAYKRGCHIDQPRNLAKSVTVE